MASEPAFENTAIPISTVPSYSISKIWDQVAPILKKAVRPVTGHTIESVKEDLQFNLMVLWIIGELDGVAVTQVQRRPTQSVVWIQYLAGKDMESWFDEWVKVIEDYARQCNCAAIEFSGRKGWHKISEKYQDYKPIMTTFRREL